MVSAAGGAVDQTLFAELAQFFRFATTDLEPCAIVKLSNNATLFDGSEGRHAIEIDDARAVNANKARRVEARFKSRQRYVYQMASTTDVNSDVVTVGFKPRYLVDRDGNDRPTGPYEQSTDWPAS